MKHIFKNVQHDFGVNQIIVIQHFKIYVLSKSFNLMNEDKFTSFENLFQRELASVNRFCVCYVLIRFIRCHEYVVCNDYFVSWLQNPSLKKHKNWM